MLGDSLLDPSDVSFDGPNYVPPEVVLLGCSLEEAGCGAESWRLFEALVHCLGTNLRILQMYPLMVPMMAHQKLHRLEINLRRPALGPTLGTLLRLDPEEL